MRDRWVWKSRWAAIGAAIAVSIGGGGVFLASASPGPAESTVVVVTPTRVLDTRDPTNLGLPGPFVSPVSQKLQITGAIATTGGTATVVPAGATGVLLNVTAVAPTANGFISVRPGDATGAPTTSSLNFNAGANLPNAVQVAMPTSGPNAGKIDITYDAYGTAGPTTELLIDVVGYLTNTGLQQLVADVATKANAADVYTKAQTDAKFATTGIMTVGVASFTADSATTDWTNGCVRQNVSPFEVRGALQLPAGVTITKMNVELLDFNSTDGTVKLVRTDTSSYTTIASATSAGASGIQTITATLATPELVTSNKYFTVEYKGGDGTNNQQVCGVSIEYTIPAGLSIVSASNDQVPSDGPPVGSE